MRSFQYLGTFDVVLCRNVAIYFSQPDRKVLFEKIADILDTEGSLIIGSAESLHDISPRFESRRHLKSVFYQVTDQTINL